MAKANDVRWYDGAKDMVERAFREARLPEERTMDIGDK